MKITLLLIGIAVVIMTGCESTAELPFQTIDGAGGGVDEPLELLQPPLPK